MASASDLPCDGDGVCMVCKKKAPELEAVTCRTCATPWHVPCLSTPPKTLSSIAEWQCPDCFFPPGGAPATLPGGAGGSSGDLIVSIRAIQADESLTEQEKARRRQELMSGVAAREGNRGEDEEDAKKSGGENDVLGLLDDKFSCSFCMQLPDRPVTVSDGIFLLRRLFLFNFLIMRYLGL